MLHMSTYKKYMLYKNKLKRLSISKLRSKIEQTGISVLSLEREAGLKRNAIHNILQGKSKRPYSKTIEAICRVLKCNQDELFSYYIEDELPIKFQSDGNVNKDLFINCADTLRNTIDIYKKNVTYTEYHKLINDAYIYSIVNELGDSPDKNYVTWIVKKSLDII